jgi:hypothetical protein
MFKGCQIRGWMVAFCRQIRFFEHPTNGIKTLKEEGKKEEGNLEIITLTFPFHTESHKGDGTRRPPFGGTIDNVRGDLRRIKEMGVHHAILQLTEPDLNQLTDTAKQVSKALNK